MVRYAWRHVPFYRETMRRLGLTPSDFRTAADLKHLPFIDPRDVHQDLERFTAQGVDRSDWLALDSSGSTGTARVVYVDSASLLANTAHGVRDRAVVPGPAAPFNGYREVCIGSYASSTARVQGFIARHTWAPEAYRLKRLYLSMEVEPAVSLERALEFGAHVVSASGSYVNDMAAALSRAGARRLPFGFVVASEGVTTESRNFLVERCGARLVSIYGAVEALKIGFSCEHWTGIHQNTDLYHIRLVDDNGADVPPGQSGEVIVSNLMNRATVLLNYRLRDVAQWLARPCPCGRTLPLLSFPQGRVCDWVPLADGGRVHSSVALAVVQDMAGVLEFQVTQHGVDDFEVQLVPDGCREWAQIEEEVRRNFLERFGGGASVEVREVREIRREENGKRRLWVVEPAANPRPGQTAGRPA
jgi:phenylacetate-CoA ligase